MLKNVLSMQEYAGKHNTQLQSIPFIFIVLLENGKSHKTRKFFQHDSKFKICPCCSFLHHGVTTTAGLWSTLKTISACFYCNRTIKHSCTVLRLNVFRRFQNGGGVPVEITARRPQPQRRQINLLYVKCAPLLFAGQSQVKEDIRTSASFRS